MEGYEYGTVPREHQREALRRGWERVGYAFLLEMGLGKSKILVDNTAMLYEAGKIDAMLIVAPKGVYTNWVSVTDGSGELRKHLPLRLHGDLVTGVWQSGLKLAERRALRERVLDTRAGLRVLVVNIEALSSVKEAIELCTEFLKTHRCMMVVDESTTIKNPTSARTKAVVRLGRWADYRRILTGSPVTRNPTDLYPQFEFLGRGLLGHTSFYSFRGEYCTLREIAVGGRSVKIITGVQNLSKLAAVLEKHSFRVRKEDCLDLPPKTYMRRTVEMTPEQARLYENMRKEAWVELSPERVVSTTAVITQLMKLHQIACGHVMTDDGRVAEVGDGRLRALMEVLEETEGSVIVWATYMADIRAICARLRKTYDDPSCVVEYHGGVSTQDRSAAIEAFQAGRSRFFVSNPQTGGMGITLTRAQTVVYYSNNYNLEQRIQSEDRCHRIGQEHPVTYVDLVAEGTVDERIITSLLSKTSIVEAVLRDGPRTWL